MPNLGVKVKCRNCANTFYFDGKFVGRNIEVEYDADEPYHTYHAKFHSCCSRKCHDGHHFKKK